jgi:type IV secretion system protein VirD4
VFFRDEYGTLPKIESAEMMFSASRSRRLQIVLIIQSFSQLEKNHGKEGAELIIDNTQLTIFGGFAPQSTSAETLSKALGSRTDMPGSVSRSRNNPPESLKMIERPLMTPDIAAACAERTGGEIRWADLIFCIRRSCRTGQSSFIFCPQSPL